VDIAFPGAKLAVFLDGCFWHSCPIHKSSPKANAEHWAAKLANNVKRDRDTDRLLAEAGWRIVRIWEHEKLDDAVGSVQAALDGVASAVAQLSAD